MPENILIGLISGVVAVGVAYMAQRNAPSRRVSDTATIIGAGGQVIGTLRAEIDRLDKELIQARGEINEPPFKKDLIDQIQTLQRQVARLGEIPSNGPIEPPG